MPEKCTAMGFFCQGEKRPIALIAKRVDFPETMA
jgi:hypothetical protein